MEYFRLPSDHTGLARPNPRGGLEIPGTVNFLKYHLAQRFQLLTAHFEISVITLYVTGMTIALQSLQNKHELVRMGVHLENLLKKNRVHCQLFIYCCFSCLQYV